MHVYCISPCYTLGATQHAIGTGFSQEIWVADVVHGLLTTPHTYALSKIALQQLESFRSVQRLRCRLLHLAAAILKLRSNPGPSLAEAPLQEPSLSQSSLPASCSMAADRYSDSNHAIWQDSRSSYSAPRIRRRFRELSVLVHPDKCSHPSAEQVNRPPADAQAQIDGQTQHKSLHQHGIAGNAFDS